MNKHLVRLTSVTYAIRGQKLLEQRGIRAYIKKLAKNFSTHGCGYALEVHGDLDTSVRILTDAGIKIVEISKGDAL